MSDLIRAEQIAVRASGYLGYGPLDFAIEEGGLTVIAATDGRSRSALMLTLCGRMKPSSGRLHAFGKTNHANHLFSRSAIGSLEEVDGIEQAITVADVVGEQLRWGRPWYRRADRVSTATLEQVCGAVFGDIPLPPLDAFVEELDDLPRALLQISLADLRTPPLLVVGGIDRLCGMQARSGVFQRLVALGAERTVITADIDAAAGLTGPCTVIELDLDGRVPAVREGE